MAPSLRNRLFEPDAKRDGLPWHHDISRELWALERCVTAGWTQSSIEGFWATARNTSNCCRMKPVRGATPSGPTDWFVQHEWREVVETLGEADLSSVMGALRSQNQEERLQRFEAIREDLDATYRRAVEALHAEGDPRNPLLRERFKSPLNHLLLWSTPLGEEEREIQREPVNRLLQGAIEGQPASHLHLLVLCEENDFHSETGVRLLGDRVFRGWENAGTWARLMVSLGTPPERIAAYFLKGCDTSERGFGLGEQLHALWATGCFLSVPELLDAVRPELPPGSPYSAAAPFA